MGKKQAIKTITTSLLKVSFFGAKVLNFFNHNMNAAQSGGAGGGGGMGKKGSQMEVKFVENLKDFF